MRDEDLREEFAAWLRPVREAEPPALPVIRRRLRRRRARQAAGGTVVLAAAAGIAVAAGLLPGPPRVPAGPPAAGSTRSPSPGITATTSGPRPGPSGYQFTAAYTVSSPVSTLVVNGGVGTVTITGSQRSTVAVSEQATYSGRPPVMTRTLTGKTLTLGYACSNCGVSYDIRVPRGMTVKVTSGPGDIQLSSLSGSVDATSNIGSVSADGLSSATASLTSNLGDVTAVFAVAPLTVHATASLGDVTIRVPGSVSYRVTIPAAGLGTSQVSVPRSASSRHVIDASSDEGDVVVAPG
jgi:hypothetical protein